VALVDVCSNDTLSLAILTGAPIFAVPDMLADCMAREQGDSSEAALLQRTRAADPMTIRSPDR
jgi:hypothetical protein